MAKTDSELDILKFAIHRETEAYNLFSALAERVENVNIRKLLEDLAAEELEHKARLELEIIKTGKTILQAETPAPFSVSDYIVTNNPAQLDMDYKDILMLCMAKEDASFRIYVNMISKTADEHLKEILLTLAQEEVRHKLRFEASYEALLKNAQ